MASQSLKCLLLLLTVLVLCDSLKFSSLDNVYQKGVEAYSNERWSECIVQFEESLHLYKIFKSVTINCRLKCKSEIQKTQINENIEDLKIFELFYNMRDCLSQCLQQGFEDVRMYNNISETILTNMQSKKPYQYLHLCYHQMNAMPKAASAAYTYLVANSDDELMKQNVNYYIQQPEVDSKEVIDLESEDYQVLFDLGLKAYKSNNWEDTVANMEEALNDYLTWENSCRAECEHQPEQEWSPEFVVLISNNVASLLTCRQKCQDKLKPVYDSGVELLADILNYLQISYYRLDRHEDAAKAVATFLILDPHDEDMLENKKIYKSLVDQKKFVERSDIVYYLKRDRYEKKLLDFFHKEGNHYLTTNTI